MLNGWERVNFYKDLINFGITFFGKYYLALTWTGIDWSRVMRDSSTSGAKMYLAKV
jgi:hypothetical protein